MLIEDRETYATIAAAAIDRSRCLPIQRRMVARLSRQFMNETDGRRLRRLRREYAKAIDLYIRLVRVAAMYASWV